MLNKGLCLVALVVAVVALVLALTTSGEQGPVGPAGPQGPQGEPPTAPDPVVLCDGEVLQIPKGSTQTYNLQGVQAGDRVEGHLEVQGGIERIALSIQGYDFVDGDIISVPDGTYEVQPKIYSRKDFAFIAEKSTTYMLKFINEWTDQWAADKTVTFSVTRYPAIPIWKE